MRRHLTRSLSAHLRAADDHSELPFHPSCPVCRRSRLNGSLDGEALVSRRTQAAIAAGLLACSTGGMSTAVASPPDEVVEGTEEVVPGNDWSSDVDFDPGGGSDQLPDAAPLTPVASAPTTDNDDSGPLEQEPVTDVSEPSLDRDADAVTVDPSASPPPVSSQPLPATQDPEPGPVADPTGTEKQAVDRGPKPDDVRMRERPRQDATKQAAPATIRRAPAPSGDVVAVTPAAAQAEPEPAQTTTEPTPATVRVVAHTSTGQAAKGQRFHTVQQGESLWSIAADLLGEDATVGGIAREVQRLWELNDERIGTGQPDLLFAGTRLRLR